ncbi:DMT family transporter [Aphanizomenon sp. CS-733/32]|nr:DMT family transporter [Aphanizomenon sp. CS-733/32]
MPICIPKKVMTTTVNVPDVQTEKKPTLNTLLLIPLAVFMLSLAPIFIRVSELEISPNATVFNRFWISTVILGLWEVITIVSSKVSQKSLEPQESWTGQDIGLFVLAAGFGAANLTAWAWSLTQTNIANSNLLHNFTPFFATLGGWLFLKHSFDSKFIIGLILASVGAITIGFEDFNLTSTHFTGDAIALLSAVFYAGNALCAEKLRAKFAATTIILWSCLFRTLWLLPITLIFDEQVFPVSVNGWLAVISLALFCQVLATVIMFHNLKKFSSGFVSLFLLLDPIITAILAWVIFAEKLSIVNWFAFFTVLAGIYLAKSGQGSQKVTDREISVDQD